MKLTSRLYESGDELYINKLYKLITKRGRSKKEYDWEWVNTWNGPGNRYLLFDEDRENGDQLIGQYSLIPTPFTFFGKNYLAGKTENCMSHPDYRGKGIYFPHEKKYFEEAKKRYQIFFTSTGNIGGAWVVRMKQGYIPLDYWVIYYSYIDLDFVKDTIEKNLKKFGTIANVVSILFSFIYRGYSSVFTATPDDSKTKITDEKTIDLNELEQLWNENRHLYGISIDRKASYLKWRINENPYYDHQYLLQYRNKKLEGFIIFHKDKKNIFRVVDILADKKDPKIFINLISQLKIYTRKCKVYSISCTMMKANQDLISAFRKNGFLNGKYLMPDKSKKNKKVKDFYAYIPEELKNDRAVAPENWYITALAREGR